MSKKMGLPLIAFSKNGSDVYAPPEIWRFLDAAYRVVGAQEVDNLALSFGDQNCQRWPDFLNC